MVFSGALTSQIPCMFSIFYSFIDRYRRDVCIFISRKYKINSFRLLLGAE
ncbi:hypothetical protein HanIR_Chr17g0847301 [Helianthus annuus]|nr:hypothetical protein HanIR_Chr17g0847301 [Helianthus annuus]